MAEKITYKDGIITTAPCQRHLGAKSAGDLFFTHLKKHTGKILQIDGITGKTDTYDSVLQRSVRLAIQMRLFGIKPTDTVTICTLNHLDSCVPFFSSLYLGAQIINLDYRIPIVEATYLMKQIDPKIIFVGLEGIDFIESVLRATEKAALIIAFGKTSKYVDYFDLLGENQAENDFEPAEIDLTENVFVFFSSGTTGLPKGICVSQGAYMRRIASAMDLENCFDRILEFSSLYWGISSLFWGIAILNGGCRIIMPTLEVRLLWEAIRNYKPTYLFLTPYDIANLWKCRDLGADSTSVKKVVIGGGVVFDYQLVRYKEMFPSAAVVPFYGLTEAGILIYFQSKTKTDLEVIKKKSGSLGFVLNGITYKVVDVDTGKTLGANQQGELLIKSQNVLTGYYQMEVPDVFDSDGWFKTGDCVYYDDEFYFYYVGRLKEVIKYQTWHVSPLFIENVVMTLDYVANVRVVGIAHEVDGEHPLAVVELKTNSSCANVEKEICEYVEEKLGDMYKLRGGVKIVEKMPVSETGKTGVRKLKAILNIA